MTQLHSLHLHERPREKLSAHGPQRLSDQELVALLLGSGTRRQPVLKLANAVLEVIDSRAESLTTKDLTQLDGIGDAKATLFVAALELARRRIRPAGLKVGGPTDAHNLVRHYANKRQEYFICITLNGAHEALATRVITIGLLDRAQVHPREVFADALADRAAAIIVAHNHPSGELEPSPEDIKVTRRLVDSGTLLGVPVLDHLVFSERGFVSLKERGHL